MAARRPAWCVEETDGATVALACYRRTVDWTYLLAVIGFVLTAINPWGGMFVAIPIAIYTLDWPAWFACLLGIPLGYVQVIVVDRLWERSMRWPWWVQLLEKRRSERLTNWLARDDAKWWLAIFGVWFGPWLVTAFARFAGHPVGRVAMPLLFGISYLTVGTAIVCKIAPQLLE